MGTREELLALLESGRGEYFSGEELARRLGVSRAAVWKAVGGLRGEGYAIDAVTNRGYSLSSDTDILSPQGIRKYLGERRPELNIEVVPLAASTNALVRERADAGAAEGLVIIANEQSAGRGRLGRSFYSPPGTGLYLSLLLRPQSFSAAQAVRITTAAAVAMCGAIEALSGRKAGIKWINDIFMAGKKVCGILTEASFGLENGLIEYAVLGLGVNLCRPEGGFPPELGSIAGAVLDSAVSDAKNRLAADFLDRFMGIYSDKGLTGYVEEYRARSLAIGRRVTVISAAGSRPAEAFGLDDQCRLLVRYDDSSEAALSSGEISIRL